MSDLSAEAIDGLLAALQSAIDSEPESGGALSLEDLAEKMGCHSQTMRKRLKPLLKSGQAECVKARRKRVDGTLCTYPAYRLKA